MTEQVVHDASELFKMKIVSLIFEIAQTDTQNDIERYCKLIKHFVRLIKRYIKRDVRQQIISLQNEMNAKLADTSVMNKTAAASIKYQYYDEIYRLAYDALGESGFFEKETYGVLPYEDELTFDELKQLIRASKKKIVEELKNVEHNQ